LVLFDLALSHLGHALLDFDTGRFIASVLAGEIFYLVQHLMTTVLNFFALIAAELGQEILHGLTLLARQIAH